MIEKIKSKLWGTPIQREMIKKIGALPIKESGFDGDNDPFVRLMDGTIFFGQTSHRYDVVYNKLGTTMKKVLKKECLQVASDIVIRYVEGGLKYGGPKKQSWYTAKPGDKVSEMGAYQGFCSIKLAQQVGTKGKVIAIEPMEDNYRLLSKNKKQNNLNQLITVNRAVWDEDKIVQFERRVGDGQSSSIEMKYSNANTYDVKAETLDTIYKRLGILPEDFMIIQLNGAEINGLRGLLSFNPKNLSIAARYDTEGKNAALEIQKLLTNRNYSAEVVEEDYVFAKLK